MLGGGQLGRYALMSGARHGLPHDRARARPGGPRRRAWPTSTSSPPTTTRPPSTVWPSTCAVVTTEFENPPAASLERLARSTRRRAVAGGSGDRPGPHGREAVPRRRRAPDRAVGVVESADAAVTVGLPAILKTARLGYDGKGQTADHLDGDSPARGSTLGGCRACSSSRCPSTPKSRDRRPHCRWTHRHVPGRREPPRRRHSRSHGGARRHRGLVADGRPQLATAVADALDYVGVLAVELFVVDGSCRQRVGPPPAQQRALDARRGRHEPVRATDPSRVRSWPRRHGDDRAGGGDGQPARRPLAAGRAGLGRRRSPTRVELHLYGKATARPGRKMGHLTITGGSADDVAAEAIELRDAISRSR